MYIVRSTKKFRKSLKKYKRSGTFNDSKLEMVVNMLAEGKKLSEKYKDHRLNGGMKEFRECHVGSDLLLIYRIIEDELVLSLINLGSHSEIFNE